MPSYSPEQAATIFRVISNHLVANPKLLETEGVFRTSGEAKLIPKIIEDILSGGFEPNYDVEEYVGVLKYTAAHLNGIDTNDALVNMFKREIAQSANNDSADILKRAQALDDFVKMLASSDELDKFYTAEVIHDYIMLTRMVEARSDKNKMTLSNLGVVSPSFTRCLPLAADDNRTMNWFSLIGKAYTEILRDKSTFKDYERSFADIYPQGNLRARNHELAKATQALQNAQQQLDDIGKSVDILKEECTQLSGQLTIFQASLAALQALPKKQQKESKHKVKQTQVVIDGIQKDLSALSARNVTISENYKKLFMQVKRSQRTINDLSGSISQLQFVTTAASMPTGPVIYSQSSVDKRPADAADVGEEQITSTNQRTRKSFGRR